MALLEWSRYRHRPCRMLRERHQICRIKVDFKVFQPKDVSFPSLQMFLMLYKYCPWDLPAANIITHFHLKQKSECLFYISERIMKAFFSALQTNGDWQLLVYGLTALTGFGAEGFSVIDSEASPVPVPQRCWTHPVPADHFFCPRWGSLGPEQWRCW